MLKYNDITRGDKLWVTHTENQIQYSFPAIVEDVNHLWVTVKYGDIEPFSTKWACNINKYNFMEDGHDGATFLANKRIKFDVSPNGIVHYRDQFSLSKKPANRNNPYLRYRERHSDHPYGDFDPKDGVSGFADLVWSIEKDRPFVRFTKPFIDWFCKRVFFKDFEKGQIKIPHFHSGTTLIHWVDEERSISYPSSRTQILKAFFEHCVPYIANWQFWELTRKHALNQPLYSDVLYKLHKAFIISSGRDASSFILHHYEEARFATVIKQLELKIFQWKEPLEDGVITQVQNERLRTLLGSLKQTISV